MRSHRPVDADLERSELVLVEYLTGPLAASYTVIASSRGANGSGWRRSDRAGGSHGDTPLRCTVRSPMSVPFLACMAAAAAFYHLPPRVLPSIHAVEGGQIGLVRFNTNGSADLGVMQVNTIWIQPLARFADMKAEAVVDHLMHDPCFSIAAAAAIMRLYLTEAHGNLMAAIGYYHSHSPGLGAAYQEKVIAAAGALFSRRLKQP